MNKSKITIEYDVACLKEQKRIPNKKSGVSGRGYTYKSIEVKDPKAWEVITVENTTAYTPGQRLTKKQIDMLCKGSSYNVVIGMPGQFRITNSRY